MRYKTISCLLVLMLLAAWPVAAREAGKNNAKTPQAKQEETPAIDPQAREIAQKMCEFMKSQKAFSFKAEVTDDRLTDNGEPVQYSFDLDADVRRPDGLRIKGEGDLLSKEFVYDGKTFTLYDKTHNVYATEEVPADIEDALAEMNNRHNLTIALADMASAKLCDHLSTAISNGRYEGLHHVHGVPAHHISFDRGDVRFQVWIAEGDQPIPKKVLITRNEAPYSTQWAAYFTDWNLNPQFQDNLFAFEPPQGSQKINFAPLQTSSAPAATPGTQKKKGGKT
jgi:hypothetical protein